jgi:hypothetical protein
MGKRLEKAYGSLSKCDSSLLAVMHQIASQIGAGPENIIAMNADGTKAEGDEPEQAIQEIQAAAHNISTIARAAIADEMERRLTGNDKGSLGDMLTNMLKGAVVKKKKKTKKAAPESGFSIDLSRLTKPSNN